MTVKSPPTLISEYASSAERFHIDAKNRSIARLTEQSVSRYPLPWLVAYARRMRDLQAGKAVTVPWEQLHQVVGDVE